MKAPAQHTFNIPREDLRTCDIRPFVETMRPFVDAPTPELVGAFWIGVEGYDDDPREIYEIQEIRDFYKKLDGEWPYLLFFANIDSSDCLPLITWCLIDNFSVVRNEQEGAESPSSVSFDIPSVEKWIESRLPPMRDLFMKAYNHKKPVRPHIFVRSNEIYQAHNLEAWHLEP
jgi:hypothetical protein